MYTVISNQTDFTTIVSLDDAKRQCRLLDFDMDDDDLTALISECSMLAQTYTNRLLTPGTVNAEADEYRSSWSLPFGNATSITSVYLDDVEYNDYEFSTTTQKLKLFKSYSNIKIEYEAGYSVDNFPVQIRRGIMMLISTLYNNRDDYISGLTVENVPLDSLSILNSVRLYNV